MHDTQDTSQPIAQSSASAYGRDVDRCRHSLLNNTDKENEMLEKQNTTVALEETAVQELVSRMRGELLRPGDAGYEQARQVYNAMIDKHNERMIEWASDYWMALHPYSAGGGYVNMIMDEGPDLVQAAYRDNYTRLVQVKAKYDPDNLFHVNQNIKPTR